jgi:putative glutamine amidotransferase
VFGVQWHPEYHDPKNPDLLDGAPILNEFLTRAREQSEATNP